MDKNINFKIIIAFIIGMALGAYIWSKPVYIQNPQQYCAEYFEKYAC